MKDRRIYYTGSAPIGEVMKTVQANSPNPELDTIREGVLYIFHKAGLIESGIHPLQVDAAIEAFMDAFAQEKFLTENKHKL